MFIKASRALIGEEFAFRIETRFDFGEKLYDIIWQANNEIDLNEEDLEKFKRFIALAEDVEDVQEIFHNVKNLPKEEDE